MNELTKGDLFIYEDENNKIEIEAFLYNETIWLSLNKIAKLFEKDKSDISRHINNIFNEEELDKTSTVAKFATVQIEGNRKVSRNIDYYNLDMIIAVGYRTNSKKATKFRQWATEIIYHRANSEKEHMGLTSWKHSPEGRILKSDVSIAKNYLTAKELEYLQDIVNMYLDIAENRAKRQIPMKMHDWVDELNTMLKTNRYEILDNKGSISAEEAKEFAEKEYDKFRIEQDKKYISDFDKIIDECKSKNK